jgi:DNA-directed RNA polymerase subunit RPC12/RpoP
VPWYVVFAGLLGGLRQSLLVEQDWCVPVGARLHVFGSSPVGALGGAHGGGPSADSLLSFAVGPFLIYRGCLAPLDLARILSEGARSFGAVSVALAGLAALATYESAACWLPMLPSLRAAAKGVVARLRLARQQRQQAQVRAAVRARAEAGVGAAAAALFAAAADGSHADADSGAAEGAPAVVAGGGPTATLSRSFIINDVHRLPAAARTGAGGDSGSAAAPRWLRDFDTMVDAIERGEAEDPYDRELTDDADAGTQPGPGSANRPSCAICSAREAALVFIPCGHRCVCITCGRRLAARWIAGTIPRRRSGHSGEVAESAVGNCPQCSADVLFMMRVFEGEGVDLP